MGHRGQSVDINPFLVWLGNVKATSYAEDTLFTSAAVQMFFDPVTRVLLRARPNRLTAADLAPRPGPAQGRATTTTVTEPIRVQRRVASMGVILVAGQRVSLGRAHAGQTVTVRASETTLAIELDDGDTRLIRRTTTHAVRSIKGQRPRTGTYVS